MVEIVCNGVQFSAIEAVIFDKDGTLADSHQYLWQLGQKRAACIDAIVPTLKDAILTMFGFEQDRLNPAGFLARSTREEDEIAIAALITQTGYDPIEARTIVKSAFQSVDQQFPRKAALTPLFPDVLDLIRSLDSVKLGILSSDTQVNVQDFVDYYQLSPPFQAIVGAQVGTSKPDPKLLSLICSLLDVDPRLALVIGDTIADTQLTHCSIGVTWGGSTIEQLMGAAAIAHHPSDIRLILD